MNMLLMYLILITYYTIRKRLSPYELKEIHSLFVIPKGHAN